MPHKPTATAATSTTSPTGLLTGGFDADDTAAAVAAIVAKRGAAYVRESSEEQGEGFSPGAQRQKIFEWAESAGIEIVAEYCDLHSAWRKSEARPEFQRLMGDAADGKFDVVLVFHTSRFARNQAEARRYKQLLRERMDIQVISVTQPLGDDPSEPSSFLAESINEMFDEYYSVSLSFWTRSGLHEKARQGHLVGLLPWGYIRDAATKLAVPDPKRAPLVLGIFARYDTGQESDRSLAAWLNAKGARTRNDREFCGDTVRDMLRNAAYCGYVSGMRDISKSIKGLHEPIVPEELFDSVQRLRSYRAAVKQPSPPSDEYLLRKMLRCQSCGARMQGTRGSRPPVRRYMCSSRRHGAGCTEPITKAEPLENQLVEWLRAFQPDVALRQQVLNAIAAHANEQNDGPDRRAELAEQLRRMQDLYVMGDLTKARYLMRRQAIQDELERLAPPADPQLTEAEEVLANFGSFWDREQAPAERHRLLSSLFEHVWQDKGRIVFVKPRSAFVPYFQALIAETIESQSGLDGVGSGSDGG
ncbi:MAG TPA: recombinase family protein [Solirubrobacteraceae bacterium]